MVAVIVLYSVINFVIQSLIQPKFQADALGLTTTLTFLSLVFWAWVLGPLGAILALPLTLLLKALFVDVDPRARWLSPLISGIPLPDGDGDGDGTATATGRQASHPRRPPDHHAPRMPVQRREPRAPPPPRSPSRHLRPNRQDDPVPQDLLTVSWKLLVLRGAIGILFGIVAIAWPQQTIVVLVVLWGVWALVDGIGLAVSAFSSGLTTGQRAVLGGLALVALVVAFIAFTRPGMAAAAVTWVLGIWLLVRGLFELVGAFSSRRSAPRWLLVLGALLDLVLGWIFVANPGAAAVGVTFVLGIVAVAWGIVFLVIGLVVRRGAAAGAPDEVVTA